MGVSINFSSVFHPQSDGQTERLNHCVEAYLRCFAGNMPSSWKKWFSMAEYWYNTIVQVNLGMTPYEALYGSKPIPLNLGDLVQRRQIDRNGKKVNQWLIKWKDLKEVEVSWEDCGFIRNEFPSFQVWGQDCSVRRDYCHDHC